MLVPASLGLALFFNDRKRMATVAMLGILVAIEQGQTTCCYAQSEKSWIADPDGVEAEVLARSRARDRPQYRSVET